MPAENPMKNARAFFSQEDYDRLRAEGVTEFAPWSSIPLILASADSDPAAAPTITQSAPDVPSATTVSPSRRGLSRRDLLWSLGGAALTGVLILARNSSPNNSSAPSAEAVPRVIPSATALPVPAGAPAPVKASPAASLEPTRVPEPIVPPKVGALPEIAGSPEIAAEKEAWKKVLGVEVEVKPLPASVTPEVRRNLEAFGFKLMYLPRLDLGTLDDLKRLGESSYLDELQRRYPNWRHYERMSDSDKKDYKISRNLNEWFWKSVKEGNVVFPKPVGYWVAAEEKPPISAGEEDKLGLGRRDIFSWGRAKGIIDSERSRILKDIGLPSMLITRMPEAIEWSLMANREGWAEITSNEWTNTAYNVPIDEVEERGKNRPFFRDSPFLFMGFEDGGAASASLGKFSILAYPISYRVAIIFDHEAKESPSVTPTPELTPRPDSPPVPKAPPVQSPIPEQTPVPRRFPPKAPIGSLFNSESQYSLASYIPEEGTGRFPLSES